MVLPCEATELSTHLATYQVSSFWTITLKRVGWVTVPIFFSPLILGINCCCVTWTQGEGFIERAGSAIVKLRTLITFRRRRMICVFSSLMSVVDVLITPGELLFLLSTFYLRDILPRMGKKASGERCDVNLSTDLHRLLGGVYTNFSA